MLKPRVLLDPSTPDGGGGTDNTGAEDLHEVVIDGETEKVSLEKLKAKYQKEEAADRKWQESAEKEKKLGASVQFDTDMQTLQKDPNDEGAFRRVADHLGWDKTKIEGAVKLNRQAEIRSAFGEDGAEEGSEEAGEAGEAPQVNLDAIASKVAEKLFPVMQEKLQVGVSNMDPKTKRAFMTVVNKHLNATLDYAVDNDEVLGTFKKHGNEKQQAAVTRMVQEEAVRRASAGRDLTDSAVVKEVLQDVRSRVAELGVSPANKPEPVPGLGASGGSGIGLHQGNKASERPKEGMASPAYGQYVWQQVAEAVHGK